MRWLLCLLLIGCSGAPEMPRAPRKVSAVADQPPKRTVYRFESGEMVVMDIPTVGPRGMADSQRCFIWRDTQLGTASLQCPSDAAGEIELPRTADSGPNY